MRYGRNGRRRCPGSCVDPAMSVCRGGKSKGDRCPGPATFERILWVLLRRPFQPNAWPIASQVNKVVNPTVVNVRIVFHETSWSGCRVGATSAIGRRSRPFGLHRNGSRAVLESEPAQRPTLDASVPQVRLGGFARAENATGPILTK